MVKIQILSLICNMAYGNSKCPTIGHLHFKFQNGSSVAFEHVYIIERSPLLYLSRDYSRMDWKALAFFPKLKP